MKKIVFQQKKSDICLSSFSNINIKFNIKNIHNMFFVHSILLLNFSKFTLLLYIDFFY